MLSITFDKFMDGEYVDQDITPYQLYVVMNNLNCLYVGVSHNNIFTRWFGGSRAHCGINIYRELYGRSCIGRKISSEMPASKKYIMQLWTIIDCVEFISKNTGHAQKETYTDIFEVEPIMIQILKPSENVIFNSYSKGVGNTEKRVIHMPIVKKTGISKTTIKPINTHKKISDNVSWISPKLRAKYGFKNEFKKGLCKN